jgi:putative transposase
LPSIFAFPPCAGWEHTIRDEADYAGHMDYVHFNPVKHGLVEHAANWPFSSFHRAVAYGLYAADWDVGMIGLCNRGERC